MSHDGYSFVQESGKSFVIQANGFQAASYDYINNIPIL